MLRKNFIKFSTMAVGGLALSSMASCKPETSSTPKSSMTSNSNEKSSISSKAMIVNKDEGDRLNVIGDNQLIKLTGADTNNQFTLIEQDNSPGIGIPPHVHENEDEVFKVISGSVEITIGDRTAILNSGDLVFCPRGIPHSWKVIGKENANVSLSIFPSGIENMFEELSNLPKGKPDMGIVTEICKKYKIAFV
jgi:quercetin dioxygenase-like cupin family protein